MCEVTRDSSMSRIRLIRFPGGTYLEDRYAEEAVFRRESDNYLSTNAVGT